MATRYWVGGTGTWDAVSTTNWSTLSGGTGGASAPTYADNVIFDSLSNATLYSVTFGQGFTGTGSISGTTLTVTAATANTLAVGATINRNTTSLIQPTDTTYIRGGTYIVNQLTGTTGGVGTYTVSASQTVTSTAIGTSAACADLTVAAPLTGAVTFAAVANGIAGISIYGSMTLPATNMTWSSRGEVVFCANTTGKTITTNGIGIGANNDKCITFDGIGGGWTLGSALTSTFATATTGVRFNGGSFSTGNFTLSANRFASLGTFTRSIGFGSSTINCTVSNWSFTSTGLTFTSGTSTVSFSSSNANVVFDGGGLTYYNVTTTNTGIGTKTFTGVNTFNNLTFATRAAGGEDSVIFSADQTVNGTLTLGNPTNYILRRFIKSDTAGTQRTLTVATAAVFTANDFQDIVIAGAAAPISGTSIGNAGNNSGITFSTPKTVYWNLVAGGSWTATAWAATSGGTPSNTNFPLVQDTAIIQDTGLTSGNTITNSVVMLMGRVDFSTRTLPMTWALTTVPLFYGPLFLSSAVTITGQTIRTGTAATTYTISGTASGVLTPNVSISVSLASLASTAAIGDVSVSGGATASLTGLLASAAVNPPTVYLLTSVFPIGIQSVGAIGDTSEFGKANIYLDGVFASGIAGIPFIRAWDNMAGNATTYTPIAPSGGSGYTPENPGGSVIWIPSIVA